MRLVSVSALLGVLLASTGYGASVEEVETYLIAPFTRDHDVTLTMTDGKKVQGRVTRGDDSKIVVQQTGGTAEIATNQIASVHFRRAKRSSGTDFLGSLVGGVGMGFAGGAAGRSIATNIRGDGTSGRVGPVLGGLVLGMAGGYIGRVIARKSITEEVTLKVIPDSRGSMQKAEPIAARARRSEFGDVHLARKVVTSASVTRWTAGEVLSMTDVPDATALAGFSESAGLAALKRAEVAAGLR